MNHNHYEYHFKSFVDLNFSINFEVIISNEPKSKTLHCTWNSVFGVDGAAGGEGDGGRVVLLVFLPPAVEQQQRQQQHHQDDEHHDAADGSPRFPLPRRKRNHDAVHYVCQNRRRRWKKKRLLTFQLRAGTESATEATVCTNGIKRQRLKVCVPNFPREREKTSFMG